jgi:CRP-like cAMP-binding protein
VEQVALARAVAAGVADVPGADVFMPTMSASALAELGELGHERVVAGGDVLYHAGDESHDFSVVLEGVVEVVRLDVDGEARRGGRGIECGGSVHQHLASSSLTVPAPRR